MNLHKTLTLSVAALLSLGLAACGDDAGETTTDPTTTAAVVETTEASEPAETTPAETTPVEEPSDEATEDAAPPASGDFPFSEGPVDPADFGAYYGPAMEGVKQVTITTETGGVPGSVTQVDLSNPDAPVSYNRMELGEQVIEVVVSDGMTHTRMDEGEWTSEPSADLGEMDVNAQFNTDAFSSIELVSAADRHFVVVMDLGLGGEGMETQMWLDEQGRVTRQLIGTGEFETTNSYDYDTPVNIPAVS